MHGSNDVVCSSEDLEQPTTSAVEQPPSETEEVQSLHQLVRARTAEAAAWRTALANPTTPNGVVIDQAVDLRRRLFDAAATARRTLERLRSAGSGQVLAAAAVAASLDAAFHAVSPIATGLCRQEHLRKSADVSSAMAARFLLAANQGVEDLLPQTVSTPLPVCCRPRTWEAL